MSTEVKEEKMTWEEERLTKSTKSFTKRVTKPKIKRRETVWE